MRSPWLILAALAGVAWYASRGGGGVPEHVKRAFASYRQGWRYQLGAKPRPGTPPNVPSSADCTGWLWWATGRAANGALLDSDDFGPLVPGPRLGAVVWYPPQPGKRYGHAGLVVAVHPNGDFDTLDMSSTSPDNRAGAVRYVQRARALWLSKNGTRFRMPSRVA